MSTRKATNGEVRGYEWGIWMWFSGLQEAVFGEIRVARKYHDNGFLATTDTIFALWSVQSSMPHASPHSCGKIVLVCRSADVCQHCGGFGGEGVCLPSVGG